MKKAAASLLLLAIFISTNSFNTLQPGKEKIEIVFTHDLKYDDLAGIKQSLFEKGIVIEYQKLEFDKKKNLKRIEFSVDCKDAYTGTAGTSKLSDKKRFGFYRDYDTNSKTPFLIGFF